MKLAALILTAVFIYASHASARDSEVLSPCFFFRGQLGSNEAAYNSLSCQRDRAFAAEEEAERRRKRDAEDAVEDRQTNKRIRLYFDKHGFNVNEIYDRQKLIGGRTILRYRNQICEFSANTGGRCANAVD